MPNSQAPFLVDQQAPLLIETHDLSPDLRACVLQFAVDHSEYQSHDGAWGACREAANKFLRELESWNLTGERLYWSWPGDIVRGPPLPHSFYCSGVFGDHYAVQVDGVVIDFTARQFDPEAPWPLIWRM